MSETVIPASDQDAQIAALTAALATAKAELAAGDQDMSIIVSHHLNACPPVIFWKTWTKEMDENDSATARG